MLGSVPQGVRASCSPAVKSSRRGHKESWILRMAGWVPESPFPAGHYKGRDSVKYLTDISVFVAVG